MGLFKKRPPLDPKDELQLHKIEISAMWSEKEQKFVEYKTMHIEGEINRLAGLLHNISHKEPAIKRMLEKANEGFQSKYGLDTIAGLDISDNISQKKVKPEGKSISQMTPEEIEDMIRKNNNDLKSD